MEKIQWKNQNASSSSDLQTKTYFFSRIYPRLPLVYSDYGLSIVHCVGRSVIGRRFLTELIGMQITCSFRCSRWWTSTRHSNDAYTQQNHHLNYYMNKTVRSVDCREYKDDHSARHNNKFIIIHSLTFIAGLVLLFFIFLFVILSTQVPFSCCFAVGCYVPYNLARRAARYNSQHSRICHDNDDVDDNDEGRHCRAKRRPTSSRKKKQKKKNNTLNKSNIVRDFFTSCRGHFSFRSLCCCLASHTCGGPRMTWFGMLYTGRARICARGTPHANTKT